MKKICLFLITSALLFSCGKIKDPMNRTIFIPDEEDPTLPAYTEWGYNSFGADYERDYFLVSYLIAPCKIIYKNNQLQFSLHGKTYREDKDMTLIFTFPFTQMSNFTDLVQLNEVNINLSDSDCVVKIVQDNDEKILDILSGNLHFKRTQLLRLDEQVNRVILSGIFDLNFLQNGFPTTISDGRFDLGIISSIFYVSE